MTIKGSQRRVNNVGVHISHCCVRHGCKYGEVDCPVFIEEFKQERRCEDCYDDYNRLVELLESMPDEEIISAFLKVKFDDE